MKAAHRPRLGLVIVLDGNVPTWLGDAAWAESSSIEVLSLRQFLGADRMYGCHVVLFCGSTFGRDDIAMCASLSRVITAPCLAYVEDASGLELFEQEVVGEFLHGGMGKAELQLRFGRFVERVCDRRHAFRVRVPDTPCCGVLFDAARQMLSHRQTGTRAKTQLSY